MYRVQVKFMQTIWADVVGLFDTVEQAEVYIRTREAGKICRIINERTSDVVG